MGLCCPRSFKEDELSRLLGVLSGDTLPLTAPAGIASAAESTLAQGQCSGAAQPTADQDGGVRACTPGGSLRPLCPSHVFPSPKSSLLSASASQRTQPAPVPAAPVPEFVHCASFRRPGLRSCRNDERTLGLVFWDHGRVPTVPVVLSVDIRMQHY